MKSKKEEVDETGVCTNQGAESPLSQRGRVGVLADKTNTDQGQCPLSQTGRAAFSLTKDGFPGGADRLSI
jgi:hypothetical protein